MSGLISRTADTFYALRFLRLLTTKWENTNAYKVGIVDENGKQLIKAKDVPQEHKKYYTIFHRLVFNIKRLLQKTPLIGRSILTNYAVGLLMLREKMEIDSDDDLLEELRKVAPELEKMIAQEQQRIAESSQQKISEQLQKGMIVTLNKDLLDNTNFEPIFKKGTKVKIDEKTNREIFGVQIFKGTHLNTNQPVLISIGDCVTASKNEPTINETQSSSASAVTTSSVGNLDIALVRRKRKYRVFDVDDESFSRFLDPKKKHKRWKDYINTEDQNYSEIRKCVKRGDMVLLRDSKGRMCSVRNYKSTK